MCAVCVVKGITECGLCCCLNCCGCSHYSHFCQAYVKTELFGGDGCARTGIGQRNFGLHFPKQADTKRVIGTAKHIEHHPYFHISIDQLLSSMSNIEGSNGEALTPFSSNFSPTENHLKLLYLISCYTAPKESSGVAEKAQWIRKVPLLVLIYEGIWRLWEEER